MATITERVYTPEDLLKIADRPMPELVDGELVERPPMGQKADMVACNIIAVLVPYGRSTLPGVVNGAHGSFQIFADDPNRVRIPDVSFTRRDRLPDGPAEGHGRVAPDLVVEVISPNDDASGLRRKIREFLKAGVPLIWVVDHEARDIQVTRADRTGELLLEGDALDGGAVLPGFSVPVAALFEGIDP